MAITLKSPEDLEGMRVAGKLAAEVLAMLKDYVKPGVTTEELDRRAYEHIVNVQKAIPANVGYHGFPKTLCTSVNHVICHGIPNEGKVLKDGDIVNLDVTVIKDGWHGDTSRMYVAGTPSVLARRLVDTTFEAMMCGIRAVRPGATLGDVGHAIQQHAEAAGFRSSRRVIMTGSCDANAARLQARHAKARRSRGVDGGFTRRREDREGQRQSEAAR